MSATVKVLEETKKSSAKRWLFCILCSGIGLLSSKAWGMKAEDACRDLFSKGAFLRAAACYNKLFERVEQDAAWKKKENLLKDRFLRHGSLCYRKAAQSAINPEVANYLKERAAELLLRSFREGYCESSFRCRMNRQQAEALKKEIGYTPLVIVTGIESARILVRGYKYQAEHRGDFNKALRPGRYEVRVDGVSKQAKTKQVILKAGTMVTLNVTPTQIRVVERRILIAKKIPPLVVAGYVVGGGILAAGLVLVIYGSVEQARLNSLISNPETAKNITDEEYSGQFNRAGVLKGIGFVSGAVGLVLLGGAVFAQVAANQAASPPSSSKGTRSKILSLY